MSEGHTWNGVPKNTQHDIVKKIEMIVRKMEQVKMFQEPLRNSIISISISYIST